MSKARLQRRQEWRATNPWGFCRFSLKMKRKLRQEAPVIIQKNELLEITVILSPDQ